ncbi:MAG: Beta-lactamase domain protein [Parcubacteria group bacterium GW2011_GWA2_47_10]|nr:MAG: Beta-lactamase domain protein [Parcubacteria group bacterium GW2011_GWA2_47_10]
MAQKLKNNREKWRLYKKQTGILILADSLSGVYNETMAQKPTISFYGGAQEVTGSCYLLEAESKKILVDCGLFQGYKFADEKNKKPFPFKASEVDALVVTHAHIDHVGRIPKLYKEGFRGIIYATAPTRDLAALMLEDAHGIMEHDCRECSEEDFLYTLNDLEGALKLFHPLEYHQKERIGNVEFQFLNAGHILGSSFVKFSVGGKSIVFTGDVGAGSSVLLPSHDELRDVNILIIESAYGNRIHKHVGDKSLLLERAIEDITQKKGTLMIPVFSTERTQDILYEINEMLEHRRIPDVPVFLDSPLAIKTTEVFKRYPHLYSEDIQKKFQEHRHLFDFKHLKTTQTVEESKSINDVKPPKVILAGSGMMTGGRILHHAERYLSDPGSILLIVGWQSPGSIGRRLIDKATEVKIHGRIIPVAAEIRSIDGFSAHADEEELKDVIARTKDLLEHVFVVQGEQAAALNLVQVVKDHYGISADAPTFGEKFEI